MSDVLVPSSAPSLFLVVEVDCNRYEVVVAAAVVVETSKSMLS